MWAATSAYHLGGHHNSEASLVANFREAANANFCTLHSKILRPSLLVCILE